MDTLALLCTLHADGPASLQRLRAAELYSIDDILGCSVETTADVLGLSMAQARRFHREARMLAMRMHTEGLDREEQMYPGMKEMEAVLTQPAPAMAAATQATQATPPMQAPADMPYPSAEADEMRKKPDIAAILAPVLERWKREDTEGDLMDPAGSCDEETPAPPSPAAEETSRATDVLDGVDDQLRDALRAAGYATLRALAEVEPLELSRATGRTYSEACRVRFLAKRAIEGGASAETTCAPMGEACTPYEVSDPVETSNYETPEVYEAPGSYEVSESYETPEVYEMPESYEAPESYQAPESYEAPEVVSTTDMHAQAEAERVLAEMADDTNPPTERFSPAPPERQYPQDPPGECDVEEEGPGGPFV